MTITKFVSPEIIFGDNALSQIGESVNRIGASKLFVASDDGVISAGWVKKALSYLDMLGLEYVVWNKVTENPKDFEVEEGAKLYQEAECDGVLAIGGGSPIDLGKAVAIVVSNGGKIKDYEGINMIRKPLPPMVVVASTAGSGSEMSQFSVIVDSERKIKMTIISKSLVPDIAIIDPIILTTKDSQLTAATGMDALTHAIEAYVSVASTELTDVNALNAIRLISGNLRKSVSNKSNIQAKRAMAMASMQAGLAFSNAILGMVHAMTHPLGGALDMPHGEANAVLLPYVMEYNLISSMEKYANIARAFNCQLEGYSLREQANQAVSAVTELARDVGIPTRLSQMGLKQEQIEELSRQAFQDACLITNPRDTDVEDIIKVFQKAL